MLVRFVPFDPATKMSEAFAVEQELAEQALIEGVLARTKGDVTMV